MKIPYRFIMNLVMCSATFASQKPLKIDPSHSIFKSDKEIELDQDFKSKPIFKQKIDALNGEKRDLEIKHKDYSDYSQLELACVMSYLIRTGALDAQKDKVQDAKRMDQIEKKLNLYHLLQRLAQQTESSKQNSNQKYPHTTLHHILQRH